MEKEFKIILTAVDMANRKGVYSLEESHTIATSLVKLRTFLGIEPEIPAKEQPDEQPDIDK